MSEDGGHNRCVTCRAVFADLAQQKVHYKEEWHRYNLNRKVAMLPPVTLEQFETKQTAHQAQKVAEEEVSMTRYRCHCCARSLTSEAALENHTRSAKHRAAERRLKNVAPEAVVVGEFEKKEPVVYEDGWETESEDEEVGGDAEDVEEPEDGSLTEKQCLFCPRHFRTLEKNFAHMAQSHSFFVPDIQYLSDSRGLARYLGEKVGFGHFCLYCGLHFHTTQAVQQHMTDKGHSKIRFESDDSPEFADYYDYRSSYPDYDPAAPNTGDALDIEKFLPERVAETDYELVLPSGAVIGHRSLQVYFKQRFRTTDTPYAPSKTRQKLASHYRVLGWNGCDSETVKRRAQDMQYIQTMKENRRHLNLGVAANKMQKFFRRQDLCF